MNKKRKKEKKVYQQPEKRSEKAICIKPDMYTSLYYTQHANGFR